MCYHSTCGVARVDNNIYSCPPAPVHYLSRDGPRRVIDIEGLLKKSWSMPVTFSSTYLAYPSSSCVLTKKPN